VCRYLGLGEADGRPSRAVLGRLSAAQARRPSACREGKKPKLVSQHGVGRLGRLGKHQLTDQGLPMEPECPGTVPGFYTSFPSLIENTQLAHLGFPCMPWMHEPGVPERRNEKQPPCIGSVGITREALARKTGQAASSLGKSDAMDQDAPRGTSSIQGRGYRLAGPVNLAKGGSGNWGDGLP